MGKGPWNTGRSAAEEDMPRKPLRREEWLVLSPAETATELPDCPGGGLAAGRHDARENTGRRPPLML